VDYEDPKSIPGLINSRRDFPCFSSAEKWPEVVGPKRAIQFRWSGARNLKLCAV